MKQSIYRLGCFFLLGLLLCSVLTLWARQYWWAEITTHFRIQYVLVSLALLCVFVWNKSRLALLVGLLCLWHGGVVWQAQYNVAAEVASPDSARPRLRVISANVLYTNQSTEALRSWVVRMEPDVLVLHELTPHWTAAVENWGIFADSKQLEIRGVAGIGVWSRFPLTESRELFAEEVWPAQVVRMTLYGTEVQLVAVHPPPPVNAITFAVRNREFKVLAEQFGNHPVPTILAGDFNSSPWSPWFADMLRYGLRDTRGGFGIQPTWPEDFPPMRVPIDHVLVTPHWAVAQRRVGPDTGSDHLPVFAELELKE